MYRSVWKMFPMIIFIYTVLLTIFLPKNVRSFPANYHRIPVRRVSQSERTNSYIMNTWSQYNNPEEGVHHQEDILTSNNAKTIIAFKEQLWPYTIVYYIVDETMENNQQQLSIVEEVIQIIIGQTCIKFQRIYPDNNEQYPVQSWVNIIENYSGCTSDFEHNPFGGSNILNLNVDTCFDLMGHAFHELLHTLGVYHEHIRQDRDQHIDIIWANIKDDIMISYISDKIIGQKNHLSYYDVQKLLIIYECNQTHSSQKQLSYADETTSQKTELTSSEPVNSTTDGPEQVTITAISTTGENVSERSTSTISSELLDKMDNVHLPTNNSTQSEHLSKDV